jgi:hypothetical protein
LILGLSYFGPSTTRPCECEVYASSDCSSLYHWADSVAPRATKRCQAPWMNWVATLFSKIRHPSYNAVFSTQDGTGCLMIKIQGWVDIRKSITRPISRDKLLYPCNNLPKLKPPIGSYDRSYSFCLSLQFARAAIGVSLGLADYRGRRSFGFA